MKIKICSIAMNIGEGRQDIYWDTEDQHLCCEDEQMENTCSSLGNAADTAYQMWILPEWEFQFAEYAVKPEYYSAWGEDTDENTVLSPDAIADICRGWDVDPETVMDQLEEREAE